MHQLTFTLQNYIRNWHGNARAYKCACTCVCIYSDTDVTEEVCVLQYLLQIRHPGQFLRVVLFSLPRLEVDSGSTADKSPHRGDSVSGTVPTLAFCVAKLR